MFVTDPLNRIIEVNPPFNRIVSLCPSQTELLFDLGLENRIVGITHYCVHPQEKTALISKVGGTKNVKTEIVSGLNPDLIIAEKEENTRETVELLAQKFPVYVTNVESFSDAIKMIHDLSKLTGTSEKGQVIINEIEDAFTPLGALKENRPMRVAYLIWRKPYMTVANNTYINSIIEKCGWINAFKNYPSRYPQITIEDLQREAPEIIFLSSEPYPFNEKHIEEIQTNICNARVYLVDGEMFSWYGSRMRLAGQYLVELASKMKNGAL